ncbi:hypothetical protein SNE25_24515 [Mucilaginibacter sabulilitoris]|uniref:HEPN AbiU2-like domain-containing protein n=1 Tax=Mucilaginibacter sabulilitoris TaxID=1173583 RepID=A0ABZ0TLS8_9SPHI|nr:hypothetical protein [Mucilaginibacter sabulilitoris]WPU92495.1 hypothetical protein SNE25_24515 [Mucilaginibacter sabulilitoris]
MSSNTSTNSVEPSKLDISVLTLWSLFVLIDQHFTALFTYRNLIDNIDDLETEENISLDTIREALIYQILLKTCAFTDEWDQHLGLKTEPEYFDEIVRLKKVLRPARRILERWKGLRKFRNHAIAHNHRDEKGNHIYLGNTRFYHTPETIGDLAYLIFALEKMVKILAGAFPAQFSNAIKLSENWQYSGFDYENHPDKDLSKEDIVKAVELATNEIQANLQKDNYPFFDASSLYLDFLKNTP